MPADRLSCNADGVCQPKSGAERGRGAYGDLCSLQEACNPDLPALKCVKDEAQTASIFRCGCDPDAANLRCGNRSVCVRGPPSWEEAETERLG